ncbi:MAG: HD domain-containing protein [Bacteroidota bacterium]
MRKIINDPVYGFITLQHPLVLQIVAHPYYQRLRRIHQMALASLVYPGAIHTRLHHSLGAYHLMCQALEELKRKGNDITTEEEIAAKIAILLHDSGHGPYSHALEGALMPGIHHEEMSLQIMQKLNGEFNGQLQMAIDIFTGTYPKKYLHQLISGQLDVDRMDYLTRDSFFTGVSEGVIGYDRIINMLTVHNGELMVEEKAIYSIEKFLVSRRLMYWQVYLHKTVLVAEQMLIKIIERARLVANNTGTTLDYFLQQESFDKDSGELLQKFVSLDDYDVLMAIKQWQHHPDKVLAALCRGILNRKLLKIKFHTEAFDEAFITQKKQEAMSAHGISEAEAGYLIFTGVVRNTTYDSSDERIHILFKDGTVKDISEVDNALIQNSLAATVLKYYICYVG